MRMQTERLDLTPMTLPHVEAELQGPSALGLLLGAAVPDGWPPGEYDADALKFFEERLREGGAAVEGWYGWYAVLREENVLVAAGGYVGPPVDGVVEIGYSVVDAYQGRGVASELVRALVERAWTKGVTRVIANTLPDNVASQSVLRRCGFVEAGEGRFVQSRA